MDVTFNMNKETLSALRDMLKSDKAILEAALSEIKDNIRRIDAALTPVEYQNVTSASDPSMSYRVTRTLQADGFYKYACSCPSFQYDRGLDEAGHCKHIRNIPFRGWTA